MTLRIACWSGPRNLDAALMRAWGNRDDTVVVDEPLHGCYLATTGTPHPQREAILAGLPTDWRDVARHLSGPIDGAPAIQYQKHVVLHLTDDIDRDWLRWLTHVFLIRDPAAVAATYAREGGELTLDDLGYRQLLELFVWVKSELGQDPPVIDRNRLLRDPRGQLARLCAQLEVPFDERMLSWPTGGRPTDGPWSTREYRGVRSATGFERLRLGEPEVPHALRPLVRAAQPLYDELLARAIELA